MLCCFQHCRPGKRAWFILIRQRGLLAYFIIYLYMGIIMSLNILIILVSVKQFLHCNAKFLLGRKCFLRLKKWQRSLGKSYRLFQRLGSWKTFQLIHYLSVMNQAFMQIGNGSNLKVIVMKLI